MKDHFIAHHFIKMNKSERRIVKDVDLMNRLLEYKFTQPI